MPDLLAPCTWPVLYPCPEPDWTDDQKQVAETMATTLLWNWTGQIYGVCTTVLRPCRQDCNQVGSTFWGRGPYSPGYAMDHSLFRCGTCGGNTCSCTWTPTVVLPGPLLGVTEVLIDGLPLPSTAYRLEGNQLIRVDGKDWPRCQDLTRPATEPDTWQITYTHGTEPPTAGQVAAGVLSIEMWKASCNDNTCQLPRRVQTVTRQGVTVALLDSFSDAAEGRTGIWVVDSWVLSVTRAPRRSRVHSPDVRRPPTPRGGSGGGAGGVDPTAVHVVGDETIDGTKTFLQPPVVPDGSFTIANTAGLQAALNVVAGDDSYVHTVAAPVATWTIPNPFTRAPLVEIYVGDQVQDIGFDLVGGQVIITWPYPMQGQAVLR